MPPTEGVKIWLTPWGIIHHESCLWHLGSNRALELVKTFHLYRYGSLRKKHQWRDRLVAVGIYPSHTGCFGLPDLYIYIHMEINEVSGLHDQQEGLRSMENLLATGMKDDPYGPYGKALQVFCRCVT